MPVSVPEISKGSGFSLFFRVIFVIASLLLIVSFGRSIFTSSYTNVSFASILEFISTNDFAQINLTVKDFIIYNDWGLFNFLRDFLNIFTGSFGVMFFLGSNLYNLLYYVVSIVVFIMG